MSPDNDVQQEIEQLEQRFAENAQGLVFAHLADAYRRAGEFAKAEGLLLHGLKNHPTYTSAYNVLGRVYLESERYADADALLDEALRLDPKLAWASMIEVVKTRKPVTSTSAVIKRARPTSSIEAWSALS